MGGGRGFLSLLASGLILVWIMDLLGFSAVRGGGARFCGEFCDGLRDDRLTIARGGLRGTIMVGGKRLSRGYKRMEPGSLRFGEQHPKFLQRGSLDSGEGGCIEVLPYEVRLVSEGGGRPGGVFSSDVTADRVRVAIDDLVPRVRWNRAPNWDREPISCFNSGECSGDIDLVRIRI
ncbi:hypothetical protein MA16_Dca009745 [Dendrobium catenatum]|uniref:Uncharacterized protein n=1 Tax=Dendrobium catenatum TaxID=906689 RepID=A0A2I0VQM4_9ASPA|nr:hypothetical protein MA16_Dca009745 [Dendrobium catenatum]